MKVGDLRKALADPDIGNDMVVLLRVESEDGDQMMMCSPADAVPDSGCGETDCLVIDGIDGVCEHGRQAHECKEERQP